MLQRPLHCEQISAVVLPPRLQSLLTMKKLWLEYSSLLVRTKIGVPFTTVEQSNQSGPTNDRSAVNARVHDLGTRWSTEARTIQFDFEFKAVEQERRRVAKDLHDEILPLLARLIRSMQSEEKIVVNALLDEVHSAIAAFRDLLGELHPVDLEELGLVAALDNICKRYVRICGRFVLFFEQTEDCALSGLQQLCIYRAMQAVLRMFAESKNDILMVNYNRIDGRTIITVRCADKLVSSAEWITSEKADFDSFESWCVLAGAKMELGAVGIRDQFPYDLIISIPEDPFTAQHSAPEEIGDLSQARLVELDNILIHAKEEWARLINQDRALFENLAVESERKRISDDIDNLILPRLKQIVFLAHQYGDHLITDDVDTRMAVIAAGVTGIMSELHPRLLAEAGLIASIQTLVDRFRRASLIETSVCSNLLPEQIDISQETKFAIYRVTQEALNNIEKHSQATHALVTVKQITDQLVVCIEDNGKGIQGSGNTLSRGLKNIRERASGIGAKVAWENAVSFASGTLVTISLRCFEPADLGCTLCDP